MCLAALLWLTTPAYANNCMRAHADGETAQGRLALGSFKDGAGRPRTAYILLLAQPACVDADDADDRVEPSAKIHVFSSQDSVHKTIHRFVGKTVQVTGRPGAAHTVYHHAPIIMDITAINPK